MNRRGFVFSSVAAAVGLTLASRGALAALAPIVDDVAAVTGAGGKVTLGKSAVQELRDSLRGALLLPGQPGYDEARRVLIDQAGTGVLRVVHVRGDAVVAAQHADDAALRPRGGALVELALGQHDHRHAVGQAQCRGQATEAGAHHDDGRQRCRNRRVSVHRVGYGCRAAGKRF
jgi:hypothetical protein